MSQEQKYTLENFPKLEEMEKELIFQALELCGGNKVKAAELLGVVPKTIYNKINKYAISNIKNINHETGE